MSDLRFNVTKAKTILSSIIIFGMLLCPAISNSQKKGALLNRTFRIEKLSPRTLFINKDPENIDLDFELYVSFNNMGELIKIGFNTRVGIDVNLLEEIGKIDVENIDDYVNRSFIAKSGNLMCTAAIINYKKYKLPRYEDRKGSKYRIRWIEADVRVEIAEDTRKGF